MGHEVMIAQGYEASTDDIKVVIPILSVIV